MNWSRRSIRLGVLLGLIALVGIAVAIPTALRPADPLLPLRDTAVASQSIALFERRHGADPFNYVVAGRLADRYLQRFQTGADLDDVLRAERVARRALPVAPNRATAQARLSFILLTQHRFEEALAAARAALVTDSLSHAGWATLFDAALATGRYPLAETALGRLSPDAVDTRLRHAHWFGALGDANRAFATLAGACRELDRSIARRASVAWCFTELARIEHSRRGPDSAASLFRHALRIQPGYRGAVEGLADLAYARGDLPQAAERYAAIRSNAHPDLYLRLTEIYEALGDSARAQREVRRFVAAATAPGAAALYAHTLALHYAAADSTRDLALAIALRDVARRPTVDAYDVLSWVRLRRGEFVEALAASDSARRWGAPTATMDYHRARILDGVGRHAEAAELMATAVAQPGLLEPHARREIARRRARVVSPGAGSPAGARR